MLADHDAEALLQARCADPFACLGLHADDEGRLWLRALFPGASTVVVHDAASGRRIAGLAQRDAAGLFEGSLPRRRQRFDYRLHITWADGHRTRLADPYAFGPLLADADLHYLSEGTHRRPFEVLGAHAVELDSGSAVVAGVRFAVWAPNAQRVSVVGSFNAWDGRRHPMRSRGGSGVWELFVPHAGLGDRYLFELSAPDGSRLPLKADPYARCSHTRGNLKPSNLVHSSNPHSNPHSNPGPSGQPGAADGMLDNPATPHHTSVVAALPPRRALTAARAAANARQAPLAIYELHAGSWQRHPDGSLHDWDTLAASLPDYVSDLGFTHVELLPITEHPFAGSWGYQTLGQYAPTERLGSPAALQRFVDACHARGLGVLLDWVPAHFPTDAHGLAQFDGTALYEYADVREGFHRDWQTLIYNFARREVRNFLAGSALYWIERFGLDGLRVDAVASMLYRDYSRQPGQWLPNVHGGRENLEAISLLQHINTVLGAECPGAITLAEESTAFPKVSAPVYAGGLGFAYKWNMGWMNDTLAYMAQDPVHRRWHHQQMSFGMVYAYNETFVLPLSHDEVVHGKGSLLAKMPGDDWQRRANLRAYYGFMWGHPGKKLLFMGQEFAQPTEWNHDTELPWGLLTDPRHAGVQRLVRDLNQVYCGVPALHRLDADAAGFEWIAAEDAPHSVYAWLRRSGIGGGGDASADHDDPLIVVVNFTPLARAGFRLGVPARASAWREVLNTDSQHYGGSNVGNGAVELSVQPVAAHGRAQSLLLTLPPLACLYLRPAGSSTDTGAQPTGQRPGNQAPA